MLLWQLKHQGGQKGMAVANEERSVGEDEQDSSQHSAVRAGEITYSTRQLRYLQWSTFYVVLFINNTVGYNHK